MYRIEFRYADMLSNWVWHNQSCTVSASDEHEARRKCIKLYGLGVDCEYEIIEVRKVGD